MDKQLSTSAKNKEITGTNKSSGVFSIVEKMTNNILESFSAARNGVFKQYNEEFAITMEEKNRAEVEQKREKTRNNLELMHNAGFDITQDRENIIGLTNSEHIETSMKIIEALDITKKINVLNKIEKIVSIGSQSSGTNSIFFHNDLLKECINFFGKEKLQEIFTHDKIALTEAENQVIKKPLSGKSINDRMEEGAKIVEFCMHMGFDSGLGSMSNFLKIGDFLSPVQNEDDEERNRRNTNYLGSYASELRYIIERFGVSFDTLFALPKKDIALYCGILRSLHNATWMKHGDHTKTVDFLVGNKASELEIKDVLDINTMIYYAEDHSIPKLQKFIEFIKGNSTKIIKKPKLKLLTDPETQSARKNYLYLKRSLKNTSYIKDFDRNNYVDDTSKIPSFLYDKNILFAVRNYVKIKNSIGDISCIRDIDRDQCLIETTKIPSFLIDETTEVHINRLCGLYKSVGRLGSRYVGKEMTINGTNRSKYIQDTNTVPHFIADEKKYEDLVKEIDCYTNIFQYVKNKDTFAISDWNIYFNHPTKLKPIIKNMQEDAEDITKNMNTILILAKKLSLQGSPFFIGNNEKSTSPRKLSNQYIKYLNQLEHKYAGLYSIGGKIHTEHSIDSKKVKEFSREFGFGNSPFQLIHGNTSVLLPPSYFPEELQFMITAMGQYGLFENHEKPQLQIGIPGRLQEEAKAGILASSMILSSKTHVEYNVESFSTTHNSQTGRRMVTHDAGVYDPSFKYNSESINGRTDVLLLRDINLIPKAKIIGSLLSQTEYDGRFAQLGMEFIRDYMDLMAKHGLSEMITDKPRIFKGGENGETADITDHYTAVKSFTDRQAMDYLIYNNTNQSDGLVVFELEKLLQIYRKKIQSIQSRFR